MERETLSILISVITIVTLVITMVLLFLLFQGKKNKLLLEQKESEKNFEQELANAQIEVHEETLRNISWELHDNIGQLITLAKIQMQNKGLSNELKNTLDQALQEVRTLSKGLNSEAIKHLNLIESINQEINRFNKLNYIAASLEVSGDYKDIPKNDKLILFRILQEFFSNTIKHAGASELIVTLEYTPQTIIINVSDNGCGFDSSKLKPNGIGLLNMKNRANLLKADFNLTSTPNKGTQLLITYRYS